MVRITRCILNVKELLRKVGTGVCILSVLAVFGSCEKKPASEPEPKEDCIDVIERLLNSQTGLGNFVFDPQTEQLQSVFCEPAAQLLQSSRMQTAQTLQLVQWSTKHLYNLSLSAWDKTRKTATCNNRQVSVLELTDGRLAVIDENDVLLR